MKIKIWGARGSIPAPLGPEVIRDKMISTLMGIADIKNDKRREALIAAISGRNISSSAALAIAEAEPESGRRRVIEKYLDSLSPLGASTASGNTPCIEIQAGKDIFIIDAGSGIRQLGQQLMAGPCGRGEGILHLFFSHAHWDHIQGFPFFRPAFIPGNKIFIYSVHDMEMALRRQQEVISFPVSLDYMQASLSFIRIGEGELLEFGDLHIHNICNYHPGDAYSYRFEKRDKIFVYASDSSFPEGIDPRPYLSFFSGADLLVFDAQFTQRESDEKEDWGHSSSFVGVEMAQQANAKNLLLFHYDPIYSDKDLDKILADTLRFQQNQYPGSPPVNILIAQEGQTFDLTPAQKTQIQQVPGSQVAILKPTGIFDELVATELKTQLTAMLTTKEPGQLIIDLAGVEMLQVAGLRTLVKLRNEHQAIPMALADPTDSVKQLIELAGYLDFFAIYPSVHAALNALQARKTLHLPGQTLKGRYRVEHKLGEGRLGTVFKATDTRQNIPVAIKILSPSFSEGAVERFLQQARHIVELKHLNIANVYECVEDRGISFMAEEFIPGKMLQDLIDDQPEQPLPFYLVLTIAERITCALDYAHSQGIIHGDLKPKNVLLADAVKITDFGLGSLEQGRSLINLNVPLALVTARYLAPEQILGQPIDSRTDLYALGVMLYELCTGQPPFTGSDQEVLAHHLHTLPPQPRVLNPAISPLLEHLILKLLDKDPDKRYTSAHKVQAILASLNGIASGELQHYAFLDSPRPELVGRQQPLQQLLALWHKAQNGQGQVVLLSGEPGLGKTRLIRALVSRLDKATLLWGPCQTLEGDLAYRPFVTALTSYFNNVPPKLAQQGVDQVWQELTQLVPELGKVIARPMPLDSDDSVVQSSAQGLDQRVRRVISNRPWLIVLDNLQWADQATLEIMTALARHCSQLALLVIGLYTESTPGEAAPLADSLAELTSQPHCTQLSLEALSQKETKALLEKIWSPALPDDLVTALYNRSRGNPLLTQLLARDLMNKGIVHWRRGSWHFESVVDPNLPEDIQAVVLERFNLLGRETQTLLNQAAVLGNSFSLDELQGMNGIPAQDILEQLDIALEQRFLQETPGQKMLRFSHVAIQQALYRSLSALKRRLLHREAGEALERQHTLDSWETAERLAYHFLQSSEPEKGLTYSIRAATQAKALYAGHTALFWYTRALDIMDHLDTDSSSHDQRFELLLSRERIYSHLGLKTLQAADLEALQALAQALNEPAKQARVHNRRSAYEYRLGHLTEASTEAQTGLIAARQARNATSESRSLGQLARIALHQGQYEPAREYLQTAQEILKESGHQQAEAVVLNELGNIHKQLSQLAESETCYQHALTISQLVGDRRGQALYLSNLGDVLRQRGDLANATQHQQDAWLINKIIGDRPGEADCLNRLGLVYNSLGRYDLADDYLDLAKRLHQQLGDERGLAHDWQVLSAIRLNQGRYQAARDYAGQALETVQRLKYKLQEGPTWFALALAQEGLGQLDKARHAYEQADMSQAEIGHKAGSLEARVGLARCALAAADLTTARRLIQPGLDLFSSAPWRLHAPIRFYLTASQILRQAGALQAAEQILEQGYRLLQDRAQTLPDPDERSAYLENGPDHRALLDQLKQPQLEQPAG